MRVIAIILGCFIMTLVIIFGTLFMVGSAQADPVELDGLTYQGRLDVEEILSTPRKPDIDWDYIDLVGRNAVIKYDPIDVCHVGIDFSCHYSHGEPVCPNTWTIDEDKCTETYGK